jgi:hypothetical protein
VDDLVEARSKVGGACRRSEIRSSCQTCGAPVTRSKQKLRSDGHAQRSRGPSCPDGHSAPSSASCRHGDSLMSADGPKCPQGVERCERTADDQSHDDHGAPSVVLRPPASESGPGHRERDHRHGSRRRRSLARRRWVAYSSATLGTKLALARDRLPTVHLRRAIPNPLDVLQAAV